MHRNQWNGLGYAARTSRHTLSALALTVCGLAYANAGQRAQQHEATASVLPAQHEQVRVWSDWAASHGQRVELVADGRVLLIAAAKRETSRSRRKVINAVVSVFDATFGPPVRPLGAPGVFFDFSERLHVMDAFDEIARINSYTNAWARSMQSSPDNFVVEDPLVAGVAPFLADSEEWNADNELAHRLGHLLLVQRFGHQPYWLTTGFAWYVEQETLGTIYCFPYRRGFVSIGSHAGWSSELSSQFKPRKSTPVSMTEITALTRGSFDDDAAARAWGAVRFLIEQQVQALPAILSELDQTWQSSGRETLPDGSWRRSANFELAADVQQQICEKHAGPELWPNMTKAFAGGIKARSAKRTAKPPTSQR